MSRFFALPVMATVVSLVGVRMIAVPAPATPVPSFAQAEAAPVQESETALPPILGPQGLWEPAPPTTPPPPPPAPKPEPIIIVLEPLPAAPAPKIEVVNAPVISPQTTVVNNYYPVVEVVTPPPPAQDVVEVPVVVGVGVPLCAAHRRPGCCLPKSVVAPQDTFFKKTPFLPPTPRRARWEP